MARNRSNGYRGMVEASTVGITMVLCTAIGLGLGYWLDRRLSTQPWLTIIFTLMGMAAGIWSVFDTAGSLSRRRK